MEPQKTILLPFLRKIAAKLSEFGITLFGVADLDGVSTLPDQTGHSFPRAVSFARRMDPAIMAGIKSGPNQAYADEYARANDNINAAAAALVAEIQKLGYDARTFGASERTDPINIRGEFPHKTAATRAGIGWVGRNCLLITQKYGPWVRLGTVFTHLPLDCAKPLTKNHCGKCRKCVEACPAGAIVGNPWKPGIQRNELLDVGCCDRWKKEHYYQFHKGHNCGICAAVCPFGR
ncbi:MAG: 4Fe-4S double cluster binding domain-containing protein [Desulfobacterales bacterium]|jgi:epoxyqueuosine reductase QueG